MEINKINENKIIIISDTHIGSILENIDYLNMVYEYALKNNIKTILHGGDLLQGTYKNVAPQFQNMINQIRHLLTIYPYHPKITNKIILGNHDFHILKKTPSLQAELTRKDFIILGIKKGYLDWQDILISISHTCPKYHIEIPNLKTLINFCGHAHKFAIHHDNKILIPTLSDDNKDNSNPGFLVATLNNKELSIELIEIIKTNIAKKLVYKRNMIES